jgi:hypothetical protein
VFYWKSFGIVRPLKKRIIEHALGAKPHAVTYRTKILNKNLLDFWQNKPKSLNLYFLIAAFK